jgi:N-acetylneuraminic acid mutarotase
VVACDDGPPLTFTEPEGATAHLSETSNSELLSDGVWRTKPSILPARAAIATGVLNRSIIVVGGENSDRRAMTRVDAYNVDTRAWSQLAALPAPRANLFGATPINGKLYVAGGWTLGITADTGKKSLFVYDPATNSWSRKANMPIAAGTEGAQAGIHGRLYVYQFAHYATSPYAGTFIRYNPATDRWVRLAVPRLHQGSPVGGAIDGKFYLAGGIDEYGKVTGRLSVYDPATDTWSERRPMSVPRNGAMAAVFHGTLVVAGGVTFSPQGAPTPLADLETYDPVTNTWIRGPSMPTARWDGAAAMSGGRVYFMGGRTDSWQPRSEVEAYLP